MEAKPLRIVPSSHNTTSGFLFHSLLFNPLLHAPPFFFTCTFFFFYNFFFILWVFSFSPSCSYVCFVDCVVCLLGGGPQKKIEMGHTFECGDVGVDEGKRIVVVVKEEKKENSSSTVELYLGVDAAANSATQTTEEILNPVNVITGARHHHHHHHQHKCCLLFTEAQRRELDHQVLIFNHFAYNLPLPPHTHHHLLQFPSNMMSGFVNSPYPCPFSVMCLCVFWPKSLKI